MLLDSNVWFPLTIVEHVKSVIAGDALSKGTDATELPTVSATDSDMESGSLIIDEGEKKKPLKRKPLTSASNTPVSNAWFFSITAMLWSM